MLHADMFYEGGLNMSLIFDMRRRIFFIIREVLVTLTGSPHLRVIISSKLCLSTIESSANPVLACQNRQKFEHWKVKIRPRCFQRHLEAASWPFPVRREKWNVGWFFKEFCKAIICSRIGVRHSLYGFCSLLPALGDSKKKEIMAWIPY